MWFIKNTKRSDARRQIFRYHDGAAMRRVDPADIQRRMREHDFEIISKSMFTRDDMGQEAYDKAIETIRKVFDVPPISAGGGLSEIELLKLLRDFNEFVATLKKPISLRPVVAPQPAQA